MTTKTLTLTKTALYLGIPKRTCYDMLNSGRFPVDQRKNSVSLGVPFAEFRPDLLQSSAPDDRRDRFIPVIDRPPIHHAIGRTRQSRNKRKGLIIVLHSSNL